MTALPVHPGWRKPTVALRNAAPRPLSPLDTVVVGGGKLTYQAVAAIRAADAAGGCTQAQLAERYGVSQPTISDIIRGTKWKGETARYRDEERWDIDALQAAIERRNAEDAPWGGSAFHDRRP